MYLPWSLLEFPVSLFYDMLLLSWITQLFLQIRLLLHKFIRILLTLYLSRPHSGNFLLQIRYLLLQMSIHLILILKYGLKYFKYFTWTYLDTKFYILLCFFFFSIFYNICSTVFFIGLLNYWRNLSLNCTLFFYIYANYLSPILTFVY